MSQDKQKPHLQIVTRDEDGRKLFDKRRKDAARSHKRRQRKKKNLDVLPVEITKDIPRRLLDQFGFEGDIAIDDAAGVMLIKSIFAAMADHYVLSRRKSKKVKE